MTTKGGGFGFTIGADYTFLKNRKYKLDAFIDLPFTFGSKFDMVSESSKKSSSEISEVKDNIFAMNAVIGVLFYPVLFKYFDVYAGGGLSFSPQVCRLSYPGIGTQEYFKYSYFGMGLNLRVGARYMFDKMFGIDICLMDSLNFITCSRKLHQWSGNNVTDYTVYYTKNKTNYDKVSNFGNFFNFNITAVIKL